MPKHDPKFRERATMWRRGEGTNKELTGRTWLCQRCSAYTVMAEAPTGWGDLAGMTLCDKCLATVWEAVEGGKLIAVSTSEWVEEYHLVKGESDAG